jgi:hypothetical protein
VHPSARETISKTTNVIKHTAASRHFQQSCDRYNYGFNSFLSPSASSGPFVRHSPHLHDLNDTKMNNNKTQQPPVKKPGANLTPSKNGVSSRPVTPTPGKANNGYIPKFTPPAEPMILPAPTVENRIEVPHSMDIVTMEDLVHRIKGKHLTQSAVSDQLLMYNPCRECVHSSSWCTCQSHHCHICFWGVISRFSSYTKKCGAGDQ